MVLLLFELLVQALYSSSEPTVNKKDSHRNKHESMNLIMTQNQTRSLHLFIRQRRFTHTHRITPEECITPEVCLVPVLCAFYFKNIEVMQPALSRLYHWWFIYNTAEDNCTHTSCNKYRLWWYYSYSIHTNDKNYPWNLSHQQEQTLSSWFGRWIAYLRTILKANWCTGT